jgi:GT2 family glycosyltransferase
MSLIEAPVLTAVVATFNNRPILERCLASWERYAAGLPVEVVVVADGCRDDTEAFLAARAETAWGRRHMRWVREDNVHELRCTNRGFREARGSLVLSWHDDMFIRTRLFVPELLRVMSRYPALGLVSLCRGLICRPAARPERWEELTDPARIESTVGRVPGNWAYLAEVDAVMRPWVVRAECVARVGPLDEAYKLSEWDEADFCFRIRTGGWKVATHAYERLGYYQHLGSSTIGRTTSDKYKAQVLANGQLFWDRWHDAIARDAGRPMSRWRRPAGFGGWAWTAARAARETGPAIARRVARR